MGLFTPKYPKGAEPPKRESRADRKHREYRERIDTAIAEDFKTAQRVSKERDAAFWADYERRSRG
jgi:hypothetical protein